MAAKDARTELPIESLAESVAMVHERSAWDKPQAPPPEEKPRRWPFWALVGVVAFALAETGMLVKQHLSAPTENDWEAAADKLKELRRPGEPVLFAPAWVDPVGRAAVGSQVPLNLLLLSDVDRFARVWQLSVRGAQHPWLSGQHVVFAQDFGAVELSRYEQSAETVLYDFTASVLEAQVERRGSQVVRCERTGRRFVCDPQQSWNWVGPHVAEVDHRPYRCIFAHAVDGQVMSITFPAAALGRTLVGYTGIDDFENRKRAQAPVLLKVFAGTEPVGQVLHQNEWPWKRFTLDTDRQKGQTHAVRFEVTTPHAYARTFCFSAEARR